jgi:hypothetical protein
LRRIEEQVRKYAQLSEWTVDGEDSAEPQARSDAFAMVDKDRVMVRGLFPNLR